MKLIVSFFVYYSFWLFTFQANAQVNTVVNADSFINATAKRVIGKSFPDFSVSNRETVVTNESIKGKVVFINLWFEACKPCMAEMDALNELYKKLKDKNDFEFISFTYENQEAIQRVKEKYNIKFPVYSVSVKECMRLSPETGFPTNLLLDRKGIIKHYFANSGSDKEKIRDYMINSAVPEIISEL